MNVEKVKQTISDSYDRKYLLKLMNGDKRFFYSFRVVNPY